LTEEMIPGPHGVAFISVKIKDGAAVLIWSARASWEWRSSPSRGRCNTL